MGLFFLFDTICAIKLRVTVMGLISAKLAIPLHGIPDQTSEQIFFRPCPTHIFSGFKIFCALSALCGYSKKGARGLLNVV